MELALNILDGYDFRGHKIKVQRAKFEMRGEYNPALKPKKKKGDKEKLQKIKEKYLIMFYFCNLRKKCFFNIVST